jgi:hypothetical protein
MKRILAPLLAALILTSSIGLTYSTHFCMGRAVEHVVNIGEHDLDCGMAAMDKDCASDEMAIDMPGCCDNEHVFVDTDDDFKITKTETGISLKFVAAFTYTFLFNNLSEEPGQAVADHSPPPLDHDYQTMFQSFLL